MIDKVNLKGKVNSVSGLFSYLKVGQITLTKENTGGKYGE